MAFLGVLLSFALIAVLFGFVLFISIAPIIIGTIVIKKTQRKKLGVALRIYGYLAFIPVWAVSIYAFVGILRLLA